eukprot:Rhum_TRINITY_DN22806_c0_g1::Rhum_TRINITY_DN22806_c0_g1_i1::g.176110::m.176110
MFPSKGRVSDGVCGRRGSPPYPSRLHPRHDCEAVAGEGQQLEQLAGAVLQRLLRGGALQEHVCLRCVVETGGVGSLNQVHQLVDQLRCTVASLADHPHSPVHLGEGRRPERVKHSLHDRLRHPTGHVQEAHLGEISAEGLVGTLKVLHCKSEVALRHLVQRGQALRRQRQVLVLRNVCYPARHRVLGDAVEAELGTPRHEGLDDPRDVVADEAEACDGAVLLDDPAQGRLCVRQESICLVEDHNLVRRHRVRHAVVRPLRLRVDGRLRERLHLLPHHLDASVVGCVELEDSRRLVLRPEELRARGKDDAGLSAAGGTVEEQVGQVRARLAEHLVEDARHLRLVHHVADLPRTVLLDPRHAGARGCGRLRRRDVRCRHFDETQVCAQASGCQ